MESLFPSHRIVFSCINNVHVDMITTEIESLVSTCSNLHLSSKTSDALLTGVSFSLYQMQSPHLERSITVCPHLEEGKIVTDVISAI